LVFKEVNAAVRKHGDMPVDLIHSAAIVMQEAGEMIHGAVDIEYGLDKTSLDELIAETTQTTATALRFLHDLLIRKGMLNDK